MAQGAMTMDSHTKTNSAALIRARNLECRRIAVIVLITPRVCHAAVEVKGAVAPAQSYSELY